MDRTAVLFALWAAVAAANSNFRAPLAGLARDSQQDLRAHYGGAGNFIVKDRVARGVEDVASPHPVDWPGPARNCCCWMRRAR